MPICSPNTSQPKPGLSDDITLTAPFVATALDTLGAPWLAAAFLATAAYINLNLPTFCASDPPADPGVTGADIASLVAFGPGPLTSGAAARVTQLAERLLWPNMCECSAAPIIVAPITPPSAPSGTPQINPVGVVTQPSLPCATYDFHLDVDNACTATYSSFIPIPPGAHTFSSTTSYQSQAGTTTNAIVVQIFFYDATAPFPGSGTGLVDGRRIDGGSPGPFDFNSTFLQAATQFAMYAQDGTGPCVSSGSADIHLSFDCSPTGTAGGNPCVNCPPDPTLTASLNAILQMVTLLQRQTAPFAYVSGASHTSLSGTGTVAVQGILGVLLNVSIPSRAGEVVGTPDTRFSVGWINFGTADGYGPRQFIESDSQVLFPTVNGIWTIVGYSLLPGVTMTLTELIREP